MTHSKFKRVNFSLTEEFSKDIDDLSFLPNSFKCSRSDVVKAAITTFKELPKEEKLKALKKISDENE